MVDGKRLLNHLAFHDTYFTAEMYLERQYHFNIITLLSPQNMTTIQQSQKNETSAK